MSPALSPVATVSATNPLAQSALDGATGIDLAKPGSEGADLAQFAALFQQLLGKQFPADPELSKTLSLAAEPSASTGGEADTAATADALSALLPFLEAMGLTKDQAAALAGTGSDHDATGAEETLLPTADLALAIPVTTASANPAITAAATEGATRSSGLTNLTNVGNGSTTPLLNSSEQVSESMDTNPIVAAANGSKPENSTGHEFATQLVEAIETSKEQPQQPGNTAQAAQQVIANHSPRNIHSPAQTTALPISHAVGSPNWGQELGDRVAWMANRMESRAELLLTPPQMGRIEVSLNVTGDQATASFVSANPAVREALEAALPRLRETLAEAGIQLGQTQVSAENAGQTAQQGKNGDNFSSGRDTPPQGDSTRSAQASAAAAPAGLKLGRGLVDVFA